MQSPLFYLKNPDVFHDVLLESIVSPCLNDKQFIKLWYRHRIGKKLNLREPKTFNEKQNWLKLFDRNPRYTRMADKYAVKALIAETVGEEYVVDNYGVYDSWRDIDFSKLPDQFVIKCTHDSGGAFVCRSKSTFDFEKTRKRIEHNLGTNCFLSSREWPYKNIKPRIIIDRFLDDHTGKELRDYKFWCFGGKPTYMYCTIKGDNVYENFYDMNFNPVMIDHGFPRHMPEFEKPANFDVMKNLATRLSMGIPFVRIDFFDVDGKVYFGEFTFFDWGGTRPFGGDWDRVLGDLIELPAY